jgi:acetyltransferase-like isoleucine patch superfamily enzyme
MVNIYRHLALSDTPLARTSRRVYRGGRNLSVPAPKVVVKPLLWIFLAVRSLYYFVKRVFICEPLFKAYCASYGKRLHTDVYVHWVMGQGDIIVGDDVEIDGKCSFAFASRYAERPTLRIGDRTGLGHGTSITVGKAVTIGRDCRIAPGVWIFDSSGHPADPEARRAGLPPRPEEVRPVTIDDNVWLGGNCVILPGVTIGSGSVVSAGAVVMSDVPPNTMVAGNPARKVLSLEPPAGAGPGAS